MKTPICDFVKEYATSGAVRAHMPGHKGNGNGAESFDITEIEGADTLFAPEGIIRESQENASCIFGARTYYSCEGSSLCIRAMVYLIKLHAASRKRRAEIIAFRNAHRSFVNAAAVFDVRVRWMHNPVCGYLESGVTPEDLDRYLCSRKTMPDAVYVTSPSYLGTLSDIRGLSSVCRRHGVILAVDNAHGSYLKFLDRSEHPIDLGADMCCDSAHKTLPVLTGGAYLHISRETDTFFQENAYRALGLTASTSPSYLILQSLDSANKVLHEDYPFMIRECVKNVEKLKKDVRNLGFDILDGEPLKLTVRTKGYGYYGYEIAEILKGAGIFCEYSDRDFTVLMLGPGNSGKDLERISDCLSSVRRREPIDETAPEYCTPGQAMNMRKAVFSPSEIIDINDRKIIGKISASAEAMCPPAVPIVLPGEVITEKTVGAMKYYGYKNCRITKEAEI